MAAVGTETAFGQGVGTILSELQRTLGEVDAAAIEQAEDLLLTARRVFVMGAGRSGLAIRMGAMRLMHLGLTVHVVGEVTAPAIEAGDALLLATGSGTTASAVQAAQTARKVGAKVVLLTAARSSSAGELADVSVLIPAATKQDHGGTVSRQYAGALFEQSVLVVMDAVFDELWHRRGEQAEELWKRHANLE